MDNLLNELAPHGVLRAGINSSNTLLISHQDKQGLADGVSPAMARALAAELGVELQLVLYPGPGDVADAANSDEWDIANIAIEPERAALIDFSPAYCEIQATYLLPPDSPIKSLADVDATGNRIAIKARSAYDLYLSRHITQATLQRADSIDASFELFVDESLEVLAGLRPKLIEQQARLPGSRLFDDSFMAVQQAIGVPTGKTQAAAYVKAFVERSLTSGKVDSLIEHYGVTGRLSASAI